MKNYTQLKVKVAAIAFASLLVAGFNQSAFSQVGISSATITPDASSMLEIRSTNTGLLIPRMTTVQRNAITSPAAGLLIYNTTTNAFNYYNGGWLALDNTNGIVAPANGGTGVANNAAMTVSGVGNYAFTRTLTGTTNVTFPTSGTLYGTTSGSITSSQISTSLSDETGTGTAVFSDSPTFTGTPTMPTGTIATTQAFGDNSTALATTAFVQSETPSYSRVTVSNATTSATALTNITGLTFAAAASSVYEFEAVLSVQSSSTAGNGYGVSFSAVGATVEAQIIGTLAATTQKILRLNLLNTIYTPFVTSGSTGGILIKGIFTTGVNAGNFTIQYLKVTSGTSTVFINSYLKVTKVQ